MQNINVNIGDILTMVELTITLLIFIHILLLPSSIYYIIINEKNCALLRNIYVTTCCMSRLS